jgi:2'-5' RNA ligase
MREQRAGMSQGTKSYALWLIPEEEACRRLARTIHRLSREHSTPVFAPHITLGSRIVAPAHEVAARTAQLAKSLPPLRLRLTRIDWRDEYFRCLFVKVAPQPQLTRAHTRARKVFGLRGRRVFLPHVSLVYGDLSPATKRNIAFSLGRRFDLEFEVRRMDIVAIEGPPSRWRRVKSFWLGRN